MKFSENSLVVDVIKISNSSYKLSVPAGDLLTAAMNGAVLRRHDLSTAAVPNVLYVPLSEAKLSSGTYSFTFASGDKFTASAADAYPAASSVSDKTDSELPAVGANDKNKYLHTNGSTGAAEWADAPNELPAVTAADKGKFLHTNESTGALEWAEGGSGGGPLVVHEDDNGVLDKTWQEIANAITSTGAVIKYEHEGTLKAAFIITYANVDQNGENYNVVAGQSSYVTNSPSGYPAVSD